jgi:hypothetical protein
MKAGILKIPRLDLSETSDLTQAFAALEKTADLSAIDQLNWPSFSYKPTLYFRIAHNGESIYLKFYVKEKAVRAVETRINGEVYKDSCVEFFVSFDGIHYYNLEFNCIGTPHIAYGESRFNRQYLPAEAIDAIQIHSTLGSEPFDTKTGDFEWELTAVIPAASFVYTQELNLKGYTATANFYKCGDELPEPHYVTWAPVETPNPDYHRPEFFREIRFE